MIEALKSSTNFYLHYLGQDITNLQIRYSAIVHKLTKYIYPQFHEKSGFIGGLSALDFILNTRVSWGNYIKF